MAFNMPKLLRDCILVPIPKGNKDPTVSDNYHPIALASTLSKALEWCILLSYSDHFHTSGLQFGFKIFFFFWFIWFNAKKTLGSGNSNQMLMLSLPVKAKER